MVAFRSFIPLLVGLLASIAYSSASKSAFDSEPEFESESVVVPPPSVVDISALSLAELDAQLQQCPIIKQLTIHLHSTTPPLSSSKLSSLFDVLFPSTHPGINALLATAYISGPPNLLLALCPANIDPVALRVMVAFAVGGLMGDTLFHLLPEIFLGEGEEGGDTRRPRLVLVEPNRNLLLGVAVLLGFMAFVGVDKGVRIAAGKGGHGHGHGHYGEHGGEYGGGKGMLGEVEAKTSGVEIGVGEKREVKSRGKVVVEKEEVVTTPGKGNGVEKGINPSVKMGGYLNLIADFTHNITDGLAMAASFYASPAIGATTTVAVFFHEIPHEVGDFALLIQSGFTKWQAMGAQFVTATGALLGTLIGILIQEYGGSIEGDDMPINAGLAGTSLVWGDLLLPFTAGTFLYVATVAVIPELLETSGKPGEVKETFAQFAAVAVGAGIMLWISWH